MSRHLSTPNFRIFVRHGTAIAALIAAIFILPAQPAAARGPDNIADVA
jgi:hypothetical protein